MSTPSEQGCAHGHPSEGVAVDMRQLKALELAARSRITFANGAWSVPSQTSATKYRVTLGNPASCTCEDFLLRQEDCKHIIATKIVAERDHNGKPVAIVADEVPKRKTYTQNWPAYNTAQREERHRFKVLLADLCRGIPEPPH